jgi:hypothetical protein
MGRIWLTLNINSPWLMGSTGRTSRNLLRKKLADTNRIRPDIRKITGRAETGVHVQVPIENDSGIRPAANPPHREPAKTQTPLIRL